MGFPDAVFSRMIGDAVLRMIDREGMMLVWNINKSYNNKGKEMNEVIAENQELDQELVHTLNTDELPSHVVQDEVRDEPEVESEVPFDQ